MKRGHPSLVARGLFFTGSAALVTYLTARNNHVSPDDALSTLALTVMTPALTVSLVGLSGPALRAERAARWVLDACGTSARARTASAAGAAAAAGAALGVLHGAALAVLLPTAPATAARLALEEATAGALLGAFCLQAVRWSTRGDGRDARRARRRGPSS